MRMSSSKAASGVRGLLRLRDEESSRDEIRRVQRRDRADVQRTEVLRVRSDAAGGVVPELSVVAVDVDATQLRSVAVEAFAPEGRRRAALPRHCRRRMPTP